MTDLVRNAPAKPAKGTALLERRANRRAIDQHERIEKDKVRKRDKTCRWPGCQCRTLKGIRLEVAHLDAKGAGGDHGVRTTVDQMILLCFLAHQGAMSLHSGDRKVQPLTEAGTNGLCAFYERNEVGLLECIAVEKYVGVSVARS